MAQLSLGLPSNLHVQSQRGTCLSRLQTRTDNSQRMGITLREPGTVRGTARRPHFSLAFISVTVQLWSQVFWVISVYFNIRNTLPKSGTFLLGHPVYIYFDSVHVQVTVRYAGREGTLPDLHNIRSPTQSNIYQMLY